MNYMNNSNQTQNAAAQNIKHCNNSVRRNVPPYTLLRSGEPIEKLVSVRETP